MAVSKRVFIDIPHRIKDPPGVNRSLIVLLFAASSHVDDQNATEADYLPLYSCMKLPWDGMMRISNM
jgi:hypothetical protein